MSRDTRRFDPTRSAPLLAAVVESAPTAIVMVDVEGRVVLVNAETEQLFDYARNDLVGESVEKLLPDRFRTAHLRDRRAYFAEPQARRMGAGRSLFARRRDGSEFPVEIGLSPVQTAEGTYVLSAVVDVSERQRLERQQHLLASMVENVEDYAILTLDLEGRITSWNAGAERIKGYRAEEIVGRHFSVFHTEEDASGARPEAELATAAAAGRHAEEGWRVRADGSRFWALVTVTPLYDAAGRFVGYSKITRDLTEQRLAEQRFRATIESAPTSMVMIDAHGRIALLNAETEKLFGYERGELLNEAVEVLLPERFRPRHPALRDSFFADPGARPMGAGRELYGRRKDGSEFPVEIGLSPVQTDQGLFVLSAVVDITARKRLEESQRSIANQKVVRAILARDGHQLEFADNGRDAVQRVAVGDFDVVLMDVQMPEMDGFEATAAIRASEEGSDRHLRIVAMIAHAMDGDREKCLAAGMDDYVSKPIRRADLITALERRKAYEEAIQD